MNKTLGLVIALLLALPAAPAPAQDAWPTRSVRLVVPSSPGAGRIRWILTTHTHVDHSPAAALLKAATGAQVMGRPRPVEGNQDHSYAPDRVLAHGERLPLDGFSLRAIHTPGHASNHLCYLLEETNMLFTGDHVMQGSTVVINPPDGDMRTYLASLELLLALDIAVFAPGHGYLRRAAPRSKAPDRAPSGARSQGRRRTAAARAGDAGRTGRRCL